MNSLHSKVMCFSWFALFLISGVCYASCLLCHCKVVV